MIPTVLAFPFRPRPTERNSLSERPPTRRRSPEAGQCDLRADQVRRQLRLRCNPRSRLPYV